MVISSVSKFTKNARIYQAYECSVIPLKLDGSKAPKIDWKPYQSQRASESVLAAWFKDGDAGIGVVCGAVSGNLCVIDFDHDADLVYPQWRDAVEEKAPGLLQKLMVVKTPRPGRHVWFRSVDPIDGNLKLARSEDGKTTLIETRGEGGYVVAHGGPDSVHPSGVPYELEEGHINDIVPLKKHEVELLLNLCRDFDRFKPPLPPDAPPGDTYVGPPRPGDVFDAHADIFKLLEEAGWSVVSGHNDGVAQLARPGKESPGSSASLGYHRDSNNRPLLHVFSTNASPFEEDRTYRPFDVFCRLKHGGDYAAAASAARELYYDELEAAQAEYEANAAAHAGSADSTVGYTPFPVECLPEVVRAYVEAHAAAIDIDPAFVGVPVLPVLAAAVGGSRALQLKTSWQEPAILWAATIAPVSSGKSPGWRAAVAPLQRIESEHNKVRLEKEETYQKLLKDYEEAKEAGEDGPKKPTPPGFTPQVIVDDATMESIAEIAVDNPKLLLSVDELAGWSKQMNQYRAGRDVENWLAFYNGAGVSINRKQGKKRLYVERAFISLTGNTQCRVADSVLFSAEALDNGLAARILFAKPPSHVVRWTDAEVEPAVDAKMNVLVEQIYGLRGDPPKHRDEKPIPLVFTDEAKALWKTWYCKAADYAETLPELLRERWLKLRPAAARIALVLSVTRQVMENPLGDAQGPVEEADLKAGITLAEWFGRELEKSCKDSPQSLLLEHLSWILANHPEGCDARTLQQGRRTIATASESKTALKNLAAQGYGSYDGSIFKADRSNPGGKTLCLAAKGGAQ